MENETNSILIKTPFTEEQVFILFTQCINAYIQIADKRVWHLNYKDAIKHNIYEQSEKMCKTLIEIHNEKLKIMETKINVILKFPDEEITTKEFRSVIKRLIKHNSKDTLLFTGEDMLVLIDKIEELAKHIADV